MDVMEALRAHGDAGAQVVELLYGDGGAEVIETISKAKQPLTPAERSERTQNRVAAASNVVGIGAGVLGTKDSLDNFRNKRAAAGKAAGKITPVKEPKLPKPPGKLQAKIGIAGEKAAAKGFTKPRIALGLAGLAGAVQVGNLAGDAVTNRVIARAKKREGMAKSADVVIQGQLTPISKSDEKRQVFGWASVVTINGTPVQDLQEDEIDLEEIEKAAYTFVRESRKGGNMHQKGLHVSDMIESMVVTPEKKEALGLPSDAPEGWWVGFKVNDNETWQDAKDGKLPMFSIHGKGKRV